MPVQESIAEAIAAIQLLTASGREIEAAAELVLKALKAGRKILACGNGGSAADGAHFATELACRFVGDRRPFPAISLTSDGGLITATANDYSFEELFARQVRAFGQPGDVLVALTTSGKSANVRRALEQARMSGLDSVALLGRDGGDCRGLATVEILVRHNSTARIQEAHKVVIHLVCELIEPQLQTLSAESGRS
jgi:D-sedoheptulose 7-phosphate isomerase